MYIWNCCWLLNQHRCRSKRDVLAISRLSFIVFFFIKFVYFMRTLAFLFRLAFVFFLFYFMSVVQKPRIFHVEQIYKAENFIYVVFIFHASVIMNLGLFWYKISCHTSLYSVYNIFESKQKINHKNKMFGFNDCCHLNN